MKRRKAREYALQFLYGFDFVATPFEEAEDSSVLALKEAIQSFWSGAGEDDPEVKMFAEELVEGTVKNLAVIDELIARVAEKWRITRMAAVDRNIMRFAAYELLFRSDIPAAVTINEALEIAKKYSTVESASFINGILDRISKEHSGARGL